MPRYFIQVSYKGTQFSGFQKQDNANSIQAEVEKALAIYFRQAFELTCSSRTDAGVHALDNYFHFDSSEAINLRKTSKGHGLNSILPAAICIKDIYEVADNAHCRFDPLSRTYQYYIYQHKNPFLQDRAYFYPYTLDIEKLAAAAKALLNHTDFTSFSKRNTQVKTFDCTLFESEWFKEGDCLVYKVRGNRFLRGMVRGLVGTMLQVGRGKTDMEAFNSIIEARDCSKADFSVPPQGLFLMKVIFP
ncbi:MAG: tRNA pseudouridine(38-40) synthase TruA [Chitinophagaceae bacterium]